MEEKLVYKYYKNIRETGSIIGTLLSSGLYVHRINAKFPSTRALNKAENAVQRLHLPRGGVRRINISKLARMYRRTSSISHVADYLLWSSFEFHSRSLCEQVRYFRAELPSPTTLPTPLPRHDVIPDTWTANKCGDERAEIKTRIVKRRGRGLAACISYSYFAHPPVPQRHTSPGHAAEAAGYIAHRNLRMTSEL